MTNSTDPLGTSKPSGASRSTRSPTTPRQHGGRHDRPLRGVVRLVHLRPAGSGVLGADLPQPLGLRLPHRSAAHLRDRVRRPSAQRNHHLPTGRPLRPTGRPDAVHLRDGARLPDHRPHPALRDDRLRRTDPVRGRPHPPRHLGRQRAAERHLVHGRTRSPEQEGPVRLLLQHGKRPRDPRRDRFRRDRDRILRSGRRSPTWGWRIPFLVGGILGVIGLLLRARADETPEFEASAARRSEVRAGASAGPAPRTPEGSAADSGAVRPGRGLLHLGHLPAHLRQA